VLVSDELESYEEAAEEAGLEHPLCRDSEGRMNLNLLPSKALNYSPPAYG